MSITDELREWWVRKFPIMDKELHKDFTAIADRIDAEHEKAMSRAGQLLADAEKERDCNYANWQECKQKVLQGNITFDELNAKIEHLMDELSHRIELPKDADGEYIRVGDVMEWPDGETFEVIGIGEGVLFYTESESDDADHAEWTGASTKRHHHAPTVEDVLREFAYGLGVPVADSYVAATAAKLRLAEEEDA